MKKAVLAFISIGIAFLFLVHTFDGRVCYREDVPHYVVCTGAYTEIVSQSQFEALAICNAICSAYEVDVDGLVEIDWSVDGSTISTWRR